MKKGKINHDFCFQKIVSRVLILSCFLTFSLFCSARVKGQEENVSMKMTNASLGSIFKEIKKQTSFDFLYDSDLVSAKKRISVDVNDKDCQEFLSELLPQVGLTYEVHDNVIIISQQKDEKAVPFYTITGIVKDEKGDAIPGATVLLKGTNLGVSTANDGTFKLRVPKAAKMTLSISFIGKETKEVEIANEAPLVIVLKEKKTEMEEVVVTGLLTRKKEGFAGAVTRISKEELQRTKTNNLFTTIANIDASFKIQENNEMGSNPNQMPEFTIRGRGSFQNNSTSPIFILDGFQVSAQKIFDMDVNRIESITLLKDAAATILYGSRAANGVVVIETTLPKAGKLTLNYSFKPTIGVVDLTGYKLMDASEKLEYERLAGIYSSEYVEKQVDLDNKYNQIKQSILEGVDTYWLSQPVQNSFSQEHSLFVEGGLNEVRYGLSFGYNGNNGVMKKSGRDRFNLGFQLIYRIRDKITIQNNITYNYTHEFNSPYGSYAQYAQLNPYERIYDINGEMISQLSNKDVNPLYNAKLKNKNFKNSDEFREQLSIDWSISNSLRFRGQLSIGKTNGHQEIFKSPYSSEYIMDKVFIGYNYQLLPVSKRGYLCHGNDRGLTFNSNYTLNYNKLILDKHLFYFGLGVDINQSRSEGENFEMTGFSDDNYSAPSFAIEYLKSGDADVRPQSNEDKNRSIGYFANLNYIYDNRYFADFSFRYDGSSQFGLDNKYAPFWSVGGGWNIQNENWLKNNKYFSTLQIKYSYGVTGNQEFSPYQAQTMYKYNTDKLYNEQITASLMGYGNPDLKWQNQYQQNIGFDFGFLRDRIRLSLNIYKKNTKGMLTDVTLSSAVGIPGNTYKTNLGEIENKGYELNANLIPYRDTEQKVEWSIGFQLSHNKNVLKKISNSLKKINELNNTENKKIRPVYVEGESMSAVKVVKSLGIDPNTGQELFVKADGTTTFEWNADDKYLAGDSEPKLFGLINTNLYWNGFNLSLSFNYKMNADYYNYTLADRVEGANPRYNADKRVLHDRWKQVGDYAKYKAVNDTKSTFLSSRFLQKEQLLQLNNVSLSYDFSQKAIQSIGLQTLRLSFFMNDVLRISTIKNERGTTYPFQRTFGFGLNTSF